MACYLFRSAFTAHSQRMIWGVTRKQISTLTPSFGHLPKASICSSVHQLLNQRQDWNTNAASLFHSSSTCHGIIEDKDSKSLTIWENVRDVPSSPTPALILGLSGLIPFVAVPAYMTAYSAYLPYLATAQIAYGACILSFLGGVRWGFVLPEENPVRIDWVNLGYSVLPSLLAWISLLMNTHLGCIALMSGLTVTAYCDMAMYGYPVWFKGLRFILSFVAVLSLWTVFMCSFLLSPQPTNKPESAEAEEQ